MGRGRSFSGVTGVGFAARKGEVAYARQARGCVAADSFRPALASVGFWGWRGRPYHLITACLASAMRTYFPSRLARAGVLHRKFILNGGYESHHESLFKVSVNKEYSLCSPRLSMWTLPSFLLASHSTRLLTGNFVPVHPRHITWPNLKRKLPIPCLLVITLFSVTVVTFEPGWIVQRLSFCS